jgi:transcriptional regulator with XRE-family HTH domain
MKSRLTALKTKAEAARKTHAYQAEGTSIRFTEELVAVMKSRGLTRTALAEKIGTSPAYITKILRGDTNFTLDSMARIAQSLDCEIDFKLRPLATPAKRRTTVSYRDASSQPIQILNEKPRK